MTRKRRGRYKLLHPQAVPKAVPLRVQNAATIVQWAVMAALIGVIVAFLLVTSLFTSFHLGQEVWVDLWPASVRLMTESEGLTPHQTTHLAFWLAAENGLLYGMFGLLLGGGFALLRTLRLRRVRRRS